VVHIQAHCQALGVIGIIMPNIKKRALKAFKSADKITFLSKSQA
jgi:hypothetical protein